MIKILKTNHDTTELIEIKTLIINENKARNLNIKYGQLKFDFHYRSLLNVYKSQTKTLRTRLRVKCYLKPFFFYLTSHHVFI